MWAWESRNNGEKIGEEKSCREGEERDNCPWVSEDGKQ